MMEETSKSKKIKTGQKIGFYLLIIGFLFILISGVLGLRIFDKVGHKPPPQPRETNITLIKEWMTIPYISRTYGVPEPEFFKSLNLENGDYGKLSISQIASQKNTDSDALINSIKTIITNFQSTHTKLPQ